MHSYSHSNLLNHTLMKGLFYALPLALTVLLSGCGAVFLAGAGVGAYSYISGNLTRVYEAGYQESIDASLSVMKTLNFNRKEESADALKTIIEGARADETPVTIEVVYVDAGWTQIGVRTGQIGIDNLEVSEQVHAHIAKQIKRRKTRATKVKSEKQEDKSAELKPQKSESLRVAPPVAQTAAASPAVSPATDAQATSDRQEDLSLFPIKGKNKTFIYYSKSELAIPQASYDALDDIVSYLTENSSATVDIRGYTDSAGDSSSNLSTSRERAFEIRDYLIDQGIAEERITAQGLGASNFLESNRTERLRNMNRRVEIIIN